MAHNVKRAARMQTLGLYKLKAIVDRGSLSSAAATYWLRKRFDIIYTYTRTGRDDYG